VNINGEAVHLEFEGYRAEIAAVAATLRTLTFEGRDLVVPFAVDQLRPLFSGVILVPWPNRIVDGDYSFDGVDYQLPINERARGHALHGLVLAEEFEVVSAGPSAATLRAKVHAQQGYPFTLAVSVEYELGADGLVTTVTATNQGAERAPYGVGPHPYITAGSPMNNECVLSLPAAAVFEVEPERLTPVALTDVAVADGGAFDFRTPHVIGTQFIDHAYSGLTLDHDGFCEVTLVRPDGAGTRMRWNGRVLPWVQIHTADRPEPERNRVGLAVEPMTCPPDAFNSGTDLVILEPNARHTASWTIGAI
jgi:aldose 1-epimerase